MKTIVKTVHSSRTMMYGELNEIINHGVFDQAEIVEANLLKKQSKSNNVSTLKLLHKLYGFKEQDQLWRVFLFLWQMAEEPDRRILSFLYAVFNDDLLRVSVPVILNTKAGKKVQVDKILEEINKQFPERYAPTTAFSAAQNIASSWKQAGFIEGKVRNIRVSVNPGYPAAVFALFLGQKEGLIGADLLKSKWMKILELSPGRIRELLDLAAMNDILHFQQAGDVTVINLDKLLNQTEA